MGGTYTMTGDFTVGSSRNLTIQNGTFDTGSYVLTTGLLTISSGNYAYPVTVNFNTGTHILTATSGTPINFA